MGSRVRVLSVTHVRPSETSSSPVKPPAIKLSLFDAMMLTLQPIERLFFYDGDDLPPFPALLATLRSSLAATLAVFPPLAGRLAVSESGDVVIDCSCSHDAVSQSQGGRGGVRFVEAEYAGTADDVRRLAGDAEHDAEAFAQLAPALEVSTLPAPALAVQVTRPEDEDDTAVGVGGGRRRIGAVVIGVSVSHVVADGRAVWDLFIPAWAAAARGGSPGFPSPVFDRAAINRRPNAEAVARAFMRIFTPALPTVKVLPKPDTTLQGRRTYLLSASQIRWLKQRISLQSKRGGDGESAAAAKPKPPSTFAAVASLVWTSGVRAKNALSAAAADAYLLFAADCRRRLRPPMPDAFFGNCVRVCYARATVGELRDDDDVGALARAAAAVRAAIDEQLEDPLGDVDRWLERNQAVPPDRFVQIGSSDRFAAYETDFGWGKPSRVEVAAVFLREFVALFGAPDGAVQVSVALDKGRMEDFETNFLSQLQGSA